MESPERYPEVLGELYATLFPRGGRSIEAPEFVPPRPLGCKSEAPECLSLQAPPYPDDPATRRWRPVPAPGVYILYSRERAAAGQLSVASWTGSIKKRTC